MRDRILGPLGMDDTGFHAADPARLATAYEDRDEKLPATDPPGRAWSRFPDEAGGLVSTAADLIAFGRMPLRGGGPVLKPQTVAETTRDQLTAQHKARVWPGFSFVGDRGRGYGVSVLADGTLARRPGYLGQRSLTRT
jgi:CubicO group peptidase (beta-lactamase class C family)